MKKGIFLTAILLVVFTIQYAHSQSPIYLGVKGGISIPNLSAGSSGTNVWNEGYSSRIGPNIGILAEFQLSPLFSIQPEINYIGEGGKRNGIQPFTIPDKYVEIYQQAFQTDKDYTFADFKNISRINYLQIPILAKFNFALNSNKKLRFYAQAGPYVAFLVGAKQIIKTDNLKVYQDKDGKQEISQDLVAGFFGTTLDSTVEAKDDLHKANIGVQGSIGFSYDIGRGKLFIQGGGNYGFIDIQKGNKHGKNHVGAGAVALGYALKLR